MIDLTETLLYTYNVHWHCTAVADSIRIACLQAVQSQHFPDHQLRGSSSLCWNLIYRHC